MAKYSEYTHAKSLYLNTNKTNEQIATEAKVSVKQLSAWMNGKGPGKY